MSAIPLLDRLTRVKQIGSDRWIAKCPAHEDRSPSLSVRELDDGKVLINCFGGCGAIDVLAAVGLDFSALFPPSGHKPSAPSHSRIPARDLLEILSLETLFVAITAADFLEKRTISEEVWSRLAQAAARIGRARDHAYGR